MDVKRILITGANGLLGKNLTLALKDKFQIFAVYHTEPQERFFGVTYIIIDFTLAWKIECLPKEIDTVIHLAQSSEFRNFPNSAINIFSVNISSTAYLLDYAKRVGVKKFIYASSGGVYDQSKFAFDENSPIIPPDNLGYYLGSKLCGEILSNSYIDVFQVIVLRFFFIYGNRQQAGMLIPRLMSNISSKKPISLQGKNGIYINPVHVQDAIAAVIAALSTEKSQTFNIAGPDIVSIRELSEAMGNYLKVKPIFQKIHGAPKNLIGDNTKMIDLLVKPYRRIKDCLSDIPFKKNDE